MVEQEAETIGPKRFQPQADLRNYMSERLELSKKMEKDDAEGSEFSDEINSQNRSLRVKKVPILNDIVFTAMADLTFFFEAITLHPELQVLLDNDIKDLLGVRRSSLQEYGFMLRRLLRSILITPNEESEAEDSEVKIHDKDFRLKLNHVIQEIVCDKTKPYLFDVFKTYKAENNVWNDFHKTWGWTGMLAYNVNEEEEEPHRTFEFDTVELLK